MAAHQRNVSVNIPAGADLTGLLHRLVQIASDGEVVLATAATQIPAGTVGEEVNAAGKITSVILLQGVVKMVAHDNSIAAGEIVVPAAAGRVIGIADHATMTADTVGVGVALDASAAQGDIVRVLCNGWIAASTD